MRRTIALLSVPVLVAGGAVLTAGSSVATTTPVNVGGLPDGGTVTIQTGFPGGAGQVTTVLKDASGEDQAPVVQDVANNTCDTLSAGPVAITASGEACYGNLGFGVDRGRDGLPWFQNFLNPNVKADETLTISAPDLGPDAVRDYLFFGSVSLDLEALRTGAGPDIQLTTYLAGQPLETKQLDLTERVVNWPPNYRVDTTLTQAADRIELTALGDTRFQLEGDTDNRAGSTFALAQANNTAFCGDAEGLSASGSGGNVSSATLTAGGDECTNEPVVFEIETDEEGNAVIALLKEPSNTEYTLEVVFTDDESPLKPIQVNYVDASDTGYEDVAQCDGTTADPALPDGQAAGFCETTRTTEITANADKFEVTATLFGKNDPRFRYR